MQPRRAGAVLHALDHAAIEHRAAVERVVVDADADRRGKVTFHRIAITRLQLAQAPRREVTRNTPHAERIRAVRGDGDLDHRVDLGGIVLGQPVNETVAGLARGQFDDAVVLFAQLHLALGGHHAKALNTTNFADADRGVDPRHIDARLGHDDGDARAGIGRAADDLHDAFVGFDLTDVQPVGIGVFLGGLHIAEGKVGQLRRRVLDAFNFEAEVGQGIGDLINRRRGVEMVLEPGEGEFHLSFLAKYRRRTAQSNIWTILPQNRAARPIATSNGHTNHTNALARNVPEM